MSISFKPLRAVVLGVAVLAVSLVSGAGAASAAPVPASWALGAGGQAKMEGNLALTNGAQTSFCNNVVFRVGLQSGGPAFNGSMSAAQCVGGTHSGQLWLRVPMGTAWKDGGSYFLKFQNYLHGADPFNIDTPWNSALVPFTNGSGSTPSKLTFNNTVVSGFIRATGTMTVKTDPGGGLVTLN